MYETHRLHPNPSFLDQASLCAVPAKPITTDEMHNPSCLFSYWSSATSLAQVHLCMSRGETFPNLHGQLDVTGLAFQILDDPS
ncbi:hypothetical protein FNV43_RR21260 [Rhamnella rubrinervis]|uniref:Uncharacterized protein n=1 Tax=Rhamnella rubrinervis TaxID=2594499 RepID=A0A8K0E1Y7_9ROSA|nr:hypothetical protein FNV43_RR21260 [Rhamnella rubrinervis]